MIEKVEENEVGQKKNIEADQKKELKILKIKKTFLLMETLQNR